MLEAIDLSKHFNGHAALNGVNLKVMPGEIYCLLGANGAGKTTLINLFLNFLDPDGGEARINGVSVVREPLETKKYVAYIPEQVMLYGVLSGAENLKYFARLAQRRLTDGEARDLLVRAGLDTSAADRRVSTYSKGMRQKVGIAIALARQVKALLLDEPTSGLDPKAANEFSRLLQRARSEGRVAILTATHDLFHAKQIGTRIGIMKRGRLITELNSDDVTHADLEQLYLEVMKD